MLSSFLIFVLLLIKGLGTSELGFNGTQLGTVNVTLMDSQQCNSILTEFVSKTNKVSIIQLSFLHKPIDIGS